MIPKIIHYCWFGKGKKSTSMLKCIESWRRYCPDYEIVEWNEDNFDLGCIPFVKDAYNAKKWAFVTDYARLKIVYENGGIYFDTDVELIKNIDELLSLDGFAGFSGNYYVATGLGFGAVKGQPMIKAILDDYENRDFPKNGDYISVACPVINTEVLVQHGLIPNGDRQTVNGLTVFPNEYFNPKDSQTYKLKITENTYSIHHYDATWRRGSKLKKLLIGAFVLAFGEKLFMKLKGAKTSDK